MPPKGANSKTTAKKIADPQAAPVPTSAARDAADRAAEAQVQREARGALLKLKQVPVPPPGKRVTRSTFNAATATPVLPLTEDDAGANDGVPRDPAPAPGAAGVAPAEQAMRVGDDGGDDDEDDDDAQTPSTGDNNANNREGGQGDHLPVMVDPYGPIELRLREYHGQKSEVFTGNVMIYKRGNEYLGEIPEILQSVADAKNNSPVKAKTGRIWRERPSFDDPGVVDNILCGRMQDILQGGGTEYMKSTVNRQLPLKKRVDPVDRADVYEAELLYQADEPLSVTARAGAIRITNATTNGPTNTSNEATPTETSAMTEEGKLQAQYNDSKLPVPFLLKLASKLGLTSRSPADPSRTVKLAHKKELFFRSVRAKANEIFGEDDPKKWMEDDQYRDQKFNDVALMDVALAKHTTWSNYKSGFEAAEEDPDMQKYLRDYPAKSIYAKMAVTTFLKEARTRLETAQEEARRSGSGSEAEEAGVMTKKTAKEKLKAEKSAKSKYKHDKDMAKFKDRLARKKKDDKDEDEGGKRKGNGKRKRERSSGVESSDQGNSKKRGKPTPHQKGKGKGKEMEVETDHIDDDTEDSEDSDESNST